MGLQATNAGIDFQQRVSAYMMILMEFDMDISLALQVNKSNTINEINFEDCESIDDLVITLDSGKKLYFQMKRTISLSDCIFRKNRALAPHERSAVPLGTDHCPVC